MLNSSINSCISQFIVYTEDSREYIRPLMKKQTNMSKLNFAHTWWWMLPTYPFLNFYWATALYQ